MLERLLLIGADFNALDPDRRVKASLRYAATPEIPAVGERVLLTDSEGNSCLATVEAVDGLAVLACPDWATWIPSQITHLSQVFASSIAEGAFSSSILPDDDHPPTRPRGEHPGLLQPA